MSECVFCKIIGKEIASDVVFESEECLVFKPIDPITKGHLLIIPKIHYKDIFDIDEGALAALTITAKTMAANIARELEATGMNLLHASGKDAQQSVFHFHLHLVPRYPSDGLDLWLRNKM